MVEGEGLHERGRWRELPLVVFGERNATSCELCPRICALLPPVEALAAAAAGPAVGQIKLSVLEPGTYIKPHGASKRQTFDSKVQGARLLNAKWFWIEDFYISVELLPFSNSFMISRDFS